MTGAETAPGGALHIKAERRACEGAAAPWRAARRAVAQFPAFRPRKGGGTFAPQGAILVNFARFHGPNFMQAGS